MKRLIRIIIYFVFLFCSLNVQAMQKYYLNTISPDKKWIAFVYRQKIVLPEDCESEPYMGDSMVDQLWLYSINTKEKRLLVNYNFLCDDPEKTILHIERIKFSPDSKVIYFQTGAWQVSDAIHAMNIDGSEEHYLIPGGIAYVIQKGRSKGDLVVGQHRYFIPFGSYDWLWLYTSTGKEEGPIGEDFGDEQRKLIEEEQY